MSTTTERRSFGEHYQFIIAMIMIIALVVFLGILYDNRDFEYAEKLIATFGAFVGVIIGFYFGQKPVQQFARQAIKAEEEKKKIEGVAEEEGTKLNNLIKERREKLKEESKERLIKQIEELDKLLKGNK